MTLSSRGPSRRRVRTSSSRVLALVVSAALCLLLALPGVASAQATPEERAAALARPAVVYIETVWSAYVQDHDGDWLNGGDPFTGSWRCTGFIVNPNGYVGTAGHCTDGVQEQAVLAGVQYWIQQGWATADQAGELFDIGMANWKVEGANAGSAPQVDFYVQHGKATSGMTTGQAWPARLIESKSIEEGDVALLKVEQTNLPVVQLASDADVAIGTPIMSIGYPGSSDEVTDATLEPTFKDGKISSKKTRGGGLIPVYEISAAISGGMSGGPTVNLDGEVVGVNSFKIWGEEQQFNFVSPSSLLTEMLGRNGVVNELGPVDTLYREGLDLFFAGSYAASIAKFDEVLARVPSHQQAQEFRVRAANAGPDTAPAEATATEAPAATPAAAEESGGMSPLVLVGAGIVVLLVLGGGLVFMLTRKKATPAAPPVSYTQPVVPPTAVPPFQQPQYQQPQYQQPQAPTQPLPGGTEPFQQPQYQQPAAPVQQPVQQPSVPADATVTPPPPAAAGAGVFCPHCGSGNVKGAAFCSTCGQSVSVAGQPVAPPQHQQ